MREPSVRLTVHAKIRSSEAKLGPKDEVDTGLIHPGSVDAIGFVGEVFDACGQSQRIGCLPTTANSRHGVARCATRGDALRITAVTAAETGGIIHHLHVPSSQ
jgi:hypothetical protein